MTSCALLSQDGQVHVDSISISHGCDRAQLQTFLIEPLTDGLLNYPCFSQSWEDVNDWAAPSFLVSWPAIEGFMLMESISSEFDLIFDLGIGKKTYRAANSKKSVQSWLEKDVRIAAGIWGFTQLGCRWKELICTDTFRPKTWHAWKSVTCGSSGIFISNRFIAKKSSWSPYLAGQGEIT